jgi:hypothetical protein
MGTIEIGNVKRLAGRNNFQIFPIVTKSNLSVYFNVEDGQVSLIMNGRKDAMNFNDLIPIMQAFTVNN